MQQISPLHGRGDERGQHLADIGKIAELLRRCVVQTQVAADAALQQQWNKEKGLITPSGSLVTENGKMPLQLLTTGKNQRLGAVTTGILL